MLVKKYQVSESCPTFFYYGFTSEPTPTPGFLATVNFYHCFLFPVILAWDLENTQILILELNFCMYKFLSSLRRVAS